MFIKETRIGVPNAFVKNRRLAAYLPDCDWMVSRVLHRQVIPYANRHRCPVGLVVSDDQTTDIK